MFAIARGTDLAIVDGRSVPLRGNLILQATRAIDLGDGSWSLPYVETTLVTEHGSFVHRPEWTNPLTGARQPVPKPQASLAQLRMDANGALSNHLEVPSGLVVDYDGVVAAQAGLEGAAWATQTLHLHFRRPGGEEEDAYLTTTLMQTGREHRGFLPADSNSVSSRPRIPAALSGGRAGSLLSTFFGRKYDSPDACDAASSRPPAAARAVLRPVAIAAALNELLACWLRSRIEGGQARRIVVPRAEET